MPYRKSPLYAMKFLKSPNIQKKNQDIHWKPQIWDQNPKFSLGLPPSLAFQLSFAPPGSNRKKNITCEIRCLLLHLPSVVLYWLLDA